MTGKVISNDGDVAIVILANGDRVRFERDWSPESKTREKFLEELPVGPFKEGIDVERLSDEVV